MKKYLALFAFLFVSLTVAYGQIPVKTIECLQDTIIKTNPQCANCTNTGTRDADFSFTGIRVTTRTGFQYYLQGPVYINRTRGFITLLGRNDVYSFDVQNSPYTIAEIYTIVSSCIPTGTGTPTTPTNLQDTSYSVNDSLLFIVNTDGDVQVYDFCGNTQTDTLVNVQCYMDGVGGFYNVFTYASGNVLAFNDANNAPIAFNPGWTECSVEAQQLRDADGDTYVELAEGVGPAGDTIKYYVDGVLQGYDINGKRDWFGVHDPLVYGYTPTDTANIINSYPAQEGWTVYKDSDNTIYKFNGSYWESAGGANFNNLSSSDTTALTQAIDPKQFTQAQIDSLNSVLGLPDADTAAMVLYDNAASGLTSTNVQGAIDELDTSVDANTANITQLSGDSHVDDDVETVSGNVDNTDPRNPIVIDEVIESAADLTGPAPAGAQWGVNTSTGAVFYVQLGTWQPAPAGANIYTADGTTTGNRTVTNTGNTLIFTGGFIELENLDYGKFEAASGAGFETNGISIGSLDLNTGGFAPIGVNGSAGLDGQVLATNGPLAAPAWEYRRDETIQFDSQNPIQPGWNIEQIRHIDILLDGSDVTMPGPSGTIVNQDLVVTITNIGAFSNSVNLPALFGHRQNGDNTDAFSSITLGVNEYQKYIVRTSPTLWRWTQVPNVQSSSLSNFYIDERAALSTGDIQSVTTNSQSDWNIVAPSTNKIDLSTPTSSINTSGDFIVGTDDITVNKGGTYDVSFTVSGIGDDKVNQYWQLVKNGLTVEQVIQTTVTNFDNADGHLAVISRTLNLSPGDIVDFRFNGSEPHTIQIQSYAITINELPSASVVPAQALNTDDQAAFGYIDLGTTRIQWGTVDANNLTSGTITFSQPFANTNYSLTTTFVANTASELITSQGSKTTTSVGWAVNIARAGAEVDWIAIGVKP